jgi:hypothetical protein
MSLFNSSKNTTNQITETNLTDNRVAATGGVAAGQGATVTINDVSADVANAALASNTLTTQGALSGVSITAQAALDANKNVALDSITAQNQTVDQALNFAAVEGSGSRELALSALKTASGQALPQSLPQGGVAALVGSDSKTLNSAYLPEIAKYAAIAAAVVGLAVVVVKVFKK